MSKRIDLFLLKMVKKHNKLITNPYIPQNPESIVIIDFYNLYCSAIRFNKYNTFTRDTFISCMSNILSSLGNRKIIIIAKIIFEVELEYIKQLTQIHTNLIYIIVEDLYLFDKTTNRERDDFVCLLFHTIFTSNKIKSYILSNDTYRNHIELIENIKPIKVNIYKNGKVNSQIYDSNTLKLHSNKIKHYTDKINRIGFRFVSS